MAPATLDFDKLLNQDADDVTSHAVALPPAGKVAAIRALAEDFNGIADLERLKALLFFQAALASLPKRLVPAGTARAVVEQVAPTARNEDRYVRQAALHVLALVVVKARMTPAIDGLLRAAFQAAKKDPDEAVRSFAALTLGPEGVLGQRRLRQPSAAPPVQRVVRVARRALHSKPTS